MTIPCISLDMLAAYFEGSLSDEDKIRMMEHLEDCGMCLERFASANSIMKNSKLDQWEPAPEELIPRLMKRLEAPPRPPVRKPAGNPIARLYNRVAELMQVPEPAMAVRSGDASAEEDACLVREVGELHTEICLEEQEGDKAAIKIRVSENGKNAENVSLTLIRTCRKKIFARNLRGEAVRFDEIPTGLYHLILEQDGLEKGNCFFEINARGLHERDNLS